MTGGLTGERPVALRAPALLASLAALVLLAALLRDAGFGLGDVAGGLAVAGTSAMFLTYGAMLDTPVLSLPFGLAAVWAAQRAWQGRPPPRPVLLATGLVAALAGWQSLLAAVLAVGPDPALPVRRRAPGRAGPGHRCPGRPGHHPRLDRLGQGDAAGPRRPGRLPDRRRHRRVAQPPGDPHRRPLRPDPAGGRGGGAGAGPGTAAAADPGDVRRPIAPPPGPACGPWPGSWPRWSSSTP